MQRLFLFYIRKAPRAFVRLRSILFFRVYLTINGYVACCCKVLQSVKALDLNRIFRQFYVRQRRLMPPINRGALCLEIVSDPVPGHITDIPAVQDHALIRIGYSLDDLSHLFFQVDQPVDFGIDLFLHLPQLFQRPYKRCLGRMVTFAEKHLYQKMR